MVYFIKPSEVIERLRTVIAAAEAAMDLPSGFVSFSNRIGGSGKLDQLTDSDVQNFPTPSCFVTLTDNSAVTTSVAVVEQDIFHGFDITVVLDTVDTRHQQAEESIVPFKELIIYCLNGWKPTDSKYSSASPLRLVGDSTMFSDGSKYVRTFTFAQEIRFKACEDGYNDQADFDIQNFENFFAELQDVLNHPTGIQLEDLNEES